MMTPRGVQKWFQNRRAKARSQIAGGSSSSLAGGATVSSALEGLNMAKVLAANNPTANVSTPAAVASAATVALSKHHQKKRAENFRWSEWSNAAGSTDNCPSVSSKPFDGLTPAQLLGLQPPVNIEEIYRFNAAIANHQIAVASQYAANNPNNNTNSGNSLLGGLNSYLLSGFSNANAGAQMSQMDLAAAAAINNLLPSPLQNALLAAGVSNSALLGQNFPPSLVAPVPMKMHAPMNANATTSLSTSPQQQLATSLSALSTSPLSSPPKSSSIPSSQNLTVPQSQPLSLSPRMQTLPSQSPQNQIAPQGLMLLSGLAGMISEQGFYIILDLNCSSIFLSIILLFIYFFNRKHPSFLKFCFLSPSFSIPSPFYQGAAVRCVHSIKRKAST